MADRQELREKVATAIANAQNSGPPPRDRTGWYGDADAAIRIVGAVLIDQAKIEAKAAMGEAASCFKDENIIGWQSHADGAEAVAERIRALTQEPTT